MNPDLPEMATLLQGTAPSVPNSAAHRQTLRERLVAEASQRRARPPSNLARPVLLSLLACASLGLAATVSVGLYRYHFVGQATDGSYLLATDPVVVYSPPAHQTKDTASGSTVAVTTSVRISGGELDQAALEQTRRDLEEVAGLRDQKARELVRVIETQVNGKRDRTCLFKYRLADGRELELGESDPAAQQRLSAPQLARDQSEIAQLRAQGRRELIRIAQTEAGGQASRTLIWQYTLSDGYQTTVGEADPTAQAAHQLSTDQVQELHRLRQLGHGTPLESTRVDVQGVAFNLQRTWLRLANGTEVIYAEGKREGVKDELTNEDWDELKRLIATGAGEHVSTSREEYMNRELRMVQRRFVLSDGTEVLRTEGTPEQVPSDATSR